MKTKFCFFFFLVFFLGTAQQIKVSYIQKRKPAMVKKETDTGPLKVELGKAALPENDPDSLYAGVRRSVDSIRKLIAENQKYDIRQEENLRLCML